VIERGTERYPFLQPLQDHWQEIRDEYFKVQDRTEKWFEDGLHNGKWEAYGLRFKNQDVPHECPRTAELVFGIPNVYIAGFSIMKPGCRIEPHVGYTRDVLRAHVGLVCPEGAWLQVGGEMYRWKEGEVVVFDDTVLHSAANESPEDRVILLVDFLRAAS